jgi:thioredoxin-dependent peroxiredoxin
MNLFPNFSLLGSDGKLYSLEDFLGSKTVFYFYPKDDTPGCTLEANDFSAKKDEFLAHGVHIVGVSADSIDSHKNFCQKYKLQILLLSDPEHILSEPLGVWGEKKNYGKAYMGMIRSTFLVDEEGKIRKEWRNVKASGHVEKVMEFVSSFI